MYKFLKELGLSEDALYFNKPIDKENLNAYDKRKLKEREKYGFDSEELWSLDFTLATWLYCHLKRFEPYISQFNGTTYVANVLVVSLDDEEKITVENKQYSPKRCFYLILDYLKTYIKEDSDIAKKKYECALKNLAEIVNGLWC